MKHESPNLENPHRDSGQGAEWDNISNDVPFHDTVRDNQSEPEAPRSLPHEAPLASEASRLREEIGKIYDKANSSQAPEEYFDIGSMDVRNRQTASPLETISKLQSQLNQIEAQQKQITTEKETAAEKANYDASINESLQQSMKLAAEEQARAVGEQIITEQNRQALMTPYEKAREITYAFLEQHPLDRKDAEQSGRHEHYQVKRLLKSVERYDADPKQEGKSFLSKLLDKRDHEANIEELRRYGYPDSPDFKRLKTSEGLNLHDFGEKRYKDYQLIQNMSQTISKKQLKEAKSSLKREGLKSLPEKWDDDNFTSHEMSTIRQILESYAREE